MTHPDLFTARARHGDPITSHQAADSVSKISEKQRLILNLFKWGGPMTDSTLITLLGGVMSESGARSRRSELVHDGYLKDSGVKKMLASGRMSIVWAIA